MKYLIFILLCVQILFAKNTSLYDQLCILNAEWKNNYEIANEYGLIQKEPILNDTELQVFHLNILNQIFSKRKTDNLSIFQKNNRINHLKVLNNYSESRKFPKNFFYFQRSPVFIDYSGIYCAVGYLMKESGKNIFCLNVQKKSNYIYIRQIESEEFSKWQDESGFTVDELAWIQPTHDDYTKLIFYHWDKFDSKNKNLPVSAKQSAIIFQNSFGNLEKQWQRELTSGLVPFYANNEYKVFSKIISNYRGSAKIPFNNEKLDINEMDPTFIFKNELFTLSRTINEDSSTFCPDNIVKWSENSKKWEVQLDLNNNFITNFFQDKGILYAAGAKVNENFSPIHSCLFKYDGKKWTEIQEDFNGLIFCFIYYNGQKYIGVASGSALYYPEGQNQEGQNQEGQ